MPQPPLLAAALRPIVQGAQLPLPPNADELAEDISVDPATLKSVASYVAQALSRLANKGKVFVHGEYWDAQCEIPISKGSRVLVKKVEGMLLTVEEKD